MSDHSHDPSRRRFVGLHLAAAGLLPTMLGTTSASAAELPHLGESDPSAIALGYVNDASRVDASTRKGAANTCANCRFYTDAGGAWGACALFPSNTVAAGGWCKSWVAK